MLYDKSEAVFYNKVQVLNRDMSIQVISQFAATRAKELQAKRLKKLERQAAAGGVPEAGLGATEAGAGAGADGIRILDALAATGLRSVRYLKEIPHVQHVTINDLDAAAVQTAMQVGANSRHPDPSPDPNPSAPLLPMIGRLRTSNGIA